ncbi:MAG: hypothetical protein AAGD07_20675 [Planctomycetota bacterium]
MNLGDAIQQISDIRQQMAKREVFRGYRSMTVGFSGVLALTGAAFQSRWLGSPPSDLSRYLCLWVGIALASASIAVVELLIRAKRAGPGLMREMTRLAAEQFLPCLIIGAVLTLFIYRDAPQVAWMLPGLWSLLFSLGIFASWRMLPSPVAWAGLYYVASGLCCLRWGQGEQSLAPWQMAATFGGGQLLCATILHWNLERDHAA